VPEGGPGQPSVQHTARPHAGLKEGRAPADSTATGGLSPGLRPASILCHPGTGFCTAGGLGIPLESLSSALMIHHRLDAALALMHSIHLKGLQQLFVRCIRVHFEAAVTVRLNLSINPS